MTEALDAFGVDAVVTPLGGDAVETRVMWLPGSTPPPPAGSFHRAEHRRVIVFPLTEGLTAVPLGTVATAPETPDGEASDWRVDSIDDVQYDHITATVVPVA
jgi:hypothetical protein